MSGSTFEILLPTYNGARFLPALLDSLFAQDFRTFQIIARDDGSTDGTPAILADYAARMPGRIRILPTGTERKGACGNFAALIDAAEADFVFTCDQDDVWLPNKMSVTYDAMVRLADRAGAERPLLVHTDLAVVGPELELLGASLHRYIRLDPWRNSLGDLLLNNVVTGCTMLLNRALYRAARPVPQRALMYDHWFAQVASAIGEIDFVDVPTILYRQHGANTVGAQRAGPARFFRSVDRTLFSDATIRVLYRYSYHARALLTRYGDQLDPFRRRQLQVLANVWEMPRGQRVVEMLRAGLRKPTLAGNIALFLLIIRDKPDAQPSRVRATRARGHP